MRSKSDQRFATAMIDILHPKQNKANFPEGTLLKSIAYISSTTSPLVGLFNWGVFFVNIFSTIRYSPTYWSNKVVSRSYHFKCKGFLKSLLDKRAMQKI
jgi:hypothetical protein